MKKIKNNNNKIGIKAIALIIATAISLTACSSENTTEITRKDDTKNVTTSEQSTSEQTSAPDETPEQEVEETKLETPDGVKEAKVVDGKTVWEIKENAHVLVNCDKIIYMPFEVEIPAEWRELVYVNTDNGNLTFSQKSSYDYYEDMPGLGFMFSFCDWKFLSPGYTGERLVAYSLTDYYYINYPTDVPFVYEDEAITQEYSKLVSFDKSMLNTLIIHADDISYDVDSYVIVNSDKVVIDGDYISNMDLRDMKRARNELYARHGAMIEDYHDFCYFRSLSWYHFDLDKDMKSAEAEFNEEEKANLNRLNDAIAQKTSELFLPKKTDMRALTKVLFHEGIGEEYVTISITGSEGDYDGVINVDGAEYVISDFEGAELENPDTEYYYITDINPYIPGQEIAIYNHGNNDNDYTLFFAEDDAAILRFIGKVYGCPFEDEYTYNGSGFDYMGSVVANEKLSIFNEAEIYRPMRYDVTEHKICDSADYDGYVFAIVPGFPRVAIQDCEGYLNPDGSGEFEIKKENTYFFLETDNKSYIKLRDKNGNTGYLKVTPQMTKEPYNYFFEADI